VSFVELKWWWEVVKIRAGAGGTQMEALLYWTGLITWAAIGLWSVALVVGFSAQLVKSNRRSGMAPTLGRSAARMAQ